MQTSAETHLVRTRRLSRDLIVFPTMGFVLLLVPNFWEQYTSGWPLLWLILAIALAVPVTGVVAGIAVNLLCEIFRESICAGCEKCGGPAWFDLCPEGGQSNLPITYTCRRCHHRQVLPVKYCDDLAFCCRRGDTSHSDAWSGGGGGGG